MTNTIPIILVLESDARAAAVGFAASLGFRSVKVAVGLPSAAGRGGSGGSGAVAVGRRC